MISWHHENPENSPHYLHAAANGPKNDGSQRHNGARCRANNNSSKRHTKRLNDPAGSPKQLASVAHVTWPTISSLLNHRSVGWLAGYIEQAAGMTFHEQHPSKFPDESFSSTCTASIWLAKGFSSTAPAKTKFGIMNCDMQAAGLALRLDRICMQHMVQRGHQ